MANLQSRRCACGTVFQLATLRSVDTECVPCQRKRAEAVMEARSGESHPRQPPSKDVIDAVDSALRVLFERGINLHLAAAEMGEVYATLIDERNQLVNRRFTQGSLSTEEHRKLNLLRWKLDRIDQARLAPTFQRTEAIVRAQEKLAESVKGMVTSIGHVGPQLIATREVLQKAREA